MNLFFVFLLFTLHVDCVLRLSPQWTLLASLQSVKIDSAAAVATVPVNPLSVNQTPVSSGLAKNSSSQGVFHWLVLLLGKLNASLPPVPWEDLFTVLAPKHPGLSKTQLRRIVNSHKTVFCVTSAGVRLFPFSHDHVRAYFDLSESVAKTVRASEAVYSLSQPCSVENTNTIVVSGVVCKAEKIESGGVLLFRFGTHVLYKLKNMKGGCKHGQMFSSVLRFR
jgi:hypothetical protein